MIKKFETVPRNGQMSFKTVVERFKEAGFDIATIRLYDAPNNETFGYYTTIDAISYADNEEPIIRVDYNTISRELLIITC